jgi:beta-lactamase class A
MNVLYCRCPHPMSAIARRFQTSFALILLTVGLNFSSLAGSLDHESLQHDLQGMTRHFGGRVGVCIQEQTKKSSINGNDRFPLQSVTKLTVAIAALDAVDHHRLSLDTTVVLRKKDLSLAIQPIAKLITSNGYRTTIADLIRRAIVDSDSAATDFLVERVGGPKAVQATRRHRLEWRLC